MSSTGVRRRVIALLPRAAALCAATMAVVTPDELLDDYHHLLASP